MGNCCFCGDDEPEVRKMPDISAPVLVEKPNNNNVLLPRQLMYAIHQSPEFRPFFWGSWWARLRGDVRTKEVLDDDRSLDRLVKILAEDPRQIHDDEDEDGLIKIIFEVLGTVIDTDGNVSESTDVRNRLEIMFPRQNIETSSLKTMPRTLINSKSSSTLGTDCSDEDLPTALKTTSDNELSKNRELGRYLSFLKRTRQEGKDSENAFELQENSPPQNDTTH